MRKGLPKSHKARLQKLGLGHYKVLIHDQPKNWLIRNFSKGADEYPVNVALLTRNIIWQLRQRIIRKEKPFYEELIRTFWYSYIKPTLARAGALSDKTDQYAQLIEQLVIMVKDYAIMDYKDIGFRDDKAANRAVGINSNIIVVAEKQGHQGFLAEIGDKYQISTIALGGQPSLLNIEYFVNDLKKQRVNLQRSFYIFTIVDYDTFGWIIKDAFIDNLKHYGIKHLQVIDLIHPDMLTEREIKYSRYPIPSESKDTITKNKKWLKEIKKRKYKNQKFLEQKEIIVNKKPRGIKLTLYGLEAESISNKRIKTILDKLLPPLLGKKDKELKNYYLKQLQKSLGNLILHKINQGGLRWPT